MEEAMKRFSALMTAAMLGAALTFSVPSELPGAAEAVTPLTPVIPLPPPIVYWGYPYYTWGYGMGPGMMGAGGFGPALCAVMASHVDGRLAYLKAELMITEAQEPLWKDYAAAFRDNAKGMLDRCKIMMGSRGAAALSLPNRMDQHEQLMAAQLDAVRAANKALKPLYASFSEDQKKTADQMFWGPMGMM